MPKACVSTYFANERLSSNLNVISGYSSSSFLFSFKPFRIFVSKQINSERERPKNGLCDRCSLLFKLSINYLLMRNEDMIVAVVLAI